MINLESTIKAHGFEPALGMVACSDKAFHGFISIAYDRDLPGEDEKAIACHNALMEDLLSRGLYPYRLGSQYGLDHFTGDNTTTNFLRTLSTAIDSSGVLGAGKYHV